VKKLSAIATTLGIAAILAGCSSPRVNLFEGSDYLMTKPPAVVAGVETKSPGIWLSKDAVTRLQNADVLSGKIE
jgi:hypothetical protein